MKVSKYTFGGLFRQDLSKHNKQQLNKQQNEKVFIIGHRSNDNRDNIGF